MIRRLLIGLAILLLLPLLVASWLVASESGLHWAFDTARPRIAAELEVTGLSGRILGPLRVESLRYRDASIAVSTASVDLRWNLWALLGGRLDVEAVEIDALAIEMPATEAAAEVTAEAVALPAALPAIELPLRLRVDGLAIDGIDIRQGDTRVHVDSLRLAGGWSARGIDIERLEVDAGDHGAQLAGRLDPTGNYSHDLKLAWRTLLRSGERLEGDGRLAGNLEQTRLAQSIRGAAPLELEVVLEQPLTRRGWRLTAVSDAFDTTRLDPALPPLGGMLRIEASGDATSFAARGEIRADSGLPVPVAANFELGQARFDADYAGIEIDALRIDTADGRLRADGRLAFTPSLAWQAQLRLADINPGRFAPAWPGRLGAELASSGQIEDGKPRAQFEISGLRGELRGYPVSLEGRLGLDGERLDIAGLEFESGNTGATLAGALGKRIDLRWTLDSPDLAELYPEASGSLVAGGTVAGPRAAPTVQATFVGTGLAFAGYAAAQIDGSAKLDLPAEPGLAQATQNLDLAFVALDLRRDTLVLKRVEINADPRRIRARAEAQAGSARLELAGRLDGLAWRGQLVGAEFETADFGHWKLAAPAPLALSAEQVSLRDLCLADASGARLCTTLTGAGADWQAEYDLTRLPLARLSPWLPPAVRLDGLAATRGNLRLAAGERLRGELAAELAPGVAVYRLTADREERLAYGGGDIGVTFGDGGIDANVQLRLRDDERLGGRLRLAGAEALALTPRNQPLEGAARLNLRDLAPLEAWFADIDGLRGRADIDVSFGGTLAAPRIGGEARLAEIAFTLPRLALEVERLDAVARSDNLETISYRLDAALAGGRVEADGSLRVDPDAGWPGSLRLRGSRLALARLATPWLPPDFELDGRLELESELELSLPDRLRGTARLTAREGSLAYPLPGGEPGRWTFRDAGLELALDADGLTARSEMVIGENSLLARIELPGARVLALDPATQSIAARLELDVRDLSLLESLQPDLQQPRGQIRVNLDAGGTLAQPRLVGRAELRDGALRIPRLGLELVEMSLTATSDEQGSVNFTAGARSGDGSIAITGESELDAGRGYPTRVQIDGSQFLIARIPEATVVVSPNLVVTVREQTVDVQGDLRVPRAKLQPRDVTSAASVSEDTVIIGGDRPPEKKWQVTAKVNVILGERVTFFGFGFEGRLDGNLTIEEQPGQPTRGNGIINIHDGRYRAYGQRLDIESGRLLFAGGPLANPGLDLRAVRKAGSVTAGLRVGGRLRQPQIELFSSPAMGQTDTLSYLLTGGPLETATGEQGAMMANAALALGLTGGDRIARSLGDRFGFDDLRVESSDSGEQASLVVGRYLSPRLYVSYGVGLVESINTLNLRYRITERWRLEAEQGAEQGADLLFSIER